MPRAEENFRFHSFFSPSLELCGLS